MATFRCLQSGNTVTFTELQDIESMKNHGSYVLVEEEEMPVKTVGRPRKVVETTPE